MSENLLVTKLYIPSLTGAFLGRPRLFQLLDEGLREGRRLTLLSSPAGYGKTTAIAGWIHSRQIPAAWISIDEGDNDPVRFHSYLAAALRTILPGFEAMSPLQVQLGNTIDAALVPLVNALAQGKGPLLIVLDDYHAIHAQPIHDSINFLLENLPAHAHIYLATRADPPLGIARLRARGQLLELRLSDLRFSSEEAGALINKATGVSLSPETIAALDVRTEGWAAGLLLAALALQASGESSQNFSGFVRSFTGSNRYILDYLVEEVLGRQPEVIQSFLLQTSILERLCASLCAAIIQPEAAQAGGGRSRSDLPDPLLTGQILAYLDRDNLFVVPLDDRREWYRYHPLFADILRQRLALARPEIIPGLHSRASQWYAGQHFMDEAIQHAFSSGDVRQAACLIEAAAQATLMRSEVTTFMGWIERLPEAELLERPNLLAYQALTQLWRGEPLEAIESRLALLARSPARPGTDAPLRAFIAINRGQLSLAQEYCRQAKASIPANEQLLHGLVDLMQAICSIIAGDVQAGVELLEKATITNRETGNVMVAVLVFYQLAELRQKEGQLRQAQALYRQALELASDQEGHPLPIAGRALVGLGEIAWIWNDPEKAENLILSGIELSQKWSIVSGFDGYLALVAFHQSQRDFSGAERELKVLREIARQFDITEADDLVVDLMAARLNIAQGNLAPAQQWASQRGFAALPVPNEAGLPENIINQRLHKYEALVAARLRLAEGCFDQAIQLLDRLLDQLGNITRPALTIETELLRACAFSGMHELDNALGALEHALAMAEPEGYVRIFIDEGEWAQALLLQVQPGLQEPRLKAFVGKILQKSPPGAEPARTVQASPGLPLIEPLSEREMQVLRLLPAGMSSQEMAAELFISSHTIRSHLKNIYAKLGAHSRFEAVARAQELRLL